MMCVVCRQGGFSSGCELVIEYAENHRYFIWNKETFPDPVEMMGDVEAVERKTVVIVDPHLKRSDQYTNAHRPR